MIEKPTLANPGSAIIFSMSMKLEKDSSKDESGDSGDVPCSQTVREKDLELSFQHELSMIEPVSDVKGRKEINGSFDDTISKRHLQPVRS